MASPYHLMYVGFLFLSLDVCPTPSPSGESHLVRYHSPARVPEIPEANIRTEQLTVPIRSSRDHLDRPRHGEVQQRHQYDCTSDKMGGRVRLALRHALGNVSCHDRGWQAKSKGRASRIRHDRNFLHEHVGPCVTSQHSRTWRRTEVTICSRGIAKPTLDFSISAHNTLIGAGTMRILASRDGRTIASATLFSAVEIYFNDNMNRFCFYLELEQLDTQCVIFAVPSKPPATRAHYRLVVNADKHMRKRPDVGGKSYVGGGIDRTTLSGFDMRFQPVCGGYFPHGRSARDRVHHAPPHSTEDASNDSFFKAAGECRGHRHGPLLRGP